MDILITGFSTYGNVSGPSGKLYRTRLEAQKDVNRHKTRSFTLGASSDRTIVLVGEDGNIYHDEYASLANFVF